ncbi:MAG: cardiolipin synthase [Lachnospiraceae bacterium]|nr:cardiolipin synthase [Lachnospiraceae bacterium]
METALSFTQSVLNFIFTYLFLINLALAVMVVFFQRKEPKSVWTWLLILYFLPIIGFILYLLIGTDMHKRKIFRGKEIEDRLSSLISNQSFGIKNREFGGGSEAKASEIINSYSDLIIYNLETSGAILTDQNEIDIIVDGKEKFKKLIEDLKKAEKSIHFQYYIIRDDELFASICEVLREKIKAGVDVRILYDCIGSVQFKEKRWQALRNEGFQIIGFFPALFRRLHLRINYRNHRKIVVIDSRVAYIGGFNVGREYIGKNENFGYWRDSHLRIDGEAVSALQARFILDWNHAAPKNHLSLDEYLTGIVYNRKGSCAAQIISDGPDTRIQNIRDNYLRLISKARKNIYIQTPYFIPDDSIISALMIAIYSGISVNIMIPDKPDHQFVYWATYSHIGEMVLAGANCYTYAKGFIHAKVMVVDEEVICCGTANMDIRSFSLNFEVNATIYDQEKAEEMTAIFIEDIKHCHRLTRDKYLARPLKIRFREQICRILSPLL